MESFFFGQADKQIYGVYHAANPALYRSRSVLLMYPVGQEYMRIHRAYRRLADYLSESGFDVLRFDYAHTGDSYGSFEDASTVAWRESAELAYDELKSLSPESKIDVVALRAGTVVCRQLAAMRPINRLVLWEPLISDRGYFDELIADIHNRGATRGNFIDDNGCLHYNGFAFSSALQEEMNNSGWVDVESRLADRVLILSTKDTIEHQSIERCIPEDISVDIKQVAGPDDWTVVDSVGGLFLPEPSLLAIKEWLLS